MRTKASNSGAVTRSRNVGLTAVCVPPTRRWMENFSSDWDHLNVRGQAAEAELIWPVVVEMLGLDDATASSAVSSTELES